MLRKGENKIVATLIVFDEEAMIEKCLSGVHKVVDKIVLVQYGECSDNTLNEL